MEHSLRANIEAYRLSYGHAANQTQSRAQAVANLLFELWADRFRRSRRFPSDPELLTRADLCLHDDTAKIRQYPREIVRCRTCGVAFATERHSLEQATEVHDASYFQANRDFIFPDGSPDVFSYVMPRVLFFWALRLQNHRPPTRRSLDVGCGNGILLKYMEFLGYEAHGVEISEWAAEYARREVGATHVTTGTLWDAAYPDNHFGLVTVVHVLEHLDDPVRLLEEALRVLEPGGMLYVEVPASERDVSDYLVGDHFWFWTVDSLCHLLGCMGLRSVHIGEGTFNCRLHNVPFIFASGEKPLDNR